MNLIRTATLLCALAILAACNFGHDVSPLASAARTGDTARIQQLITAGADPNAGSGVNGWSPLMHAIHKNQPGSVEALLAAGADVNLRGTNGQTALKMASDAGNTGIVKILLAHGAEARHSSLRN